jgi:hypothetical protein
VVGVGKEGRITSDSLSSSSIGCVRIDAFSFYKAVFETLYL